MKHAAQRIDVATFVAEVARQHQFRGHKRRPSAQPGDPFSGVDRRLGGHGVRVARQRNLQEPHPPRAFTISTARRFAAQGIERQAAMHGTAPMQFGHRHKNRQHEPAGLSRRQRAQAGQFIGQRQPVDILADDEPIAVRLFQRPSPAEDRIDGVVGDRRPPHDLGPDIHPLAEFPIEQHEAYRPTGWLVPPTKQPPRSVVLQPLHEPVVAHEKRAGIAMQQPPALPLRQDSALHEPLGDRSRGSIVTRRGWLARRLADMLATHAGEHVVRHQSAGGHELPEILGGGGGHGGLCRRKGGRLAYPLRTSSREGV